MVKIIVYNDKYAKQSKKLVLDIINNEFHFKKSPALILTT